MKEVRELSACAALAKSCPHYKADVFSACLIESGFAPEQVVISRRSGLEQSSLYDIEKVSLKYSYLYPDNPYLDIESGCPGIYDSLPEELFYSPDYSAQEREKSLIISRIRNNKQTELAVRRFLKLFEIESDSFLSDIRTKELKYDKRHTYEEFASAFEQHWDVIALMPRCVALRFLKVIPHIHSMRGNPKVATEAISFILNVPTDIQWVDRARGAQVSPAPALWDMRLEYNSVLDSEGTGSESVALVTLSELDVEACVGYFEGKQKEKVLRYLTELFFEVNTLIEIEIVPKEDSRNFLMGKADNDAYLGINTYLVAP